MKPPRRPPPPPRRDPTEIVFGVRASLAVFSTRKDDIVKIAHARALHPDASELVRWAASRRVPCTAMADGELDRVAESAHHEGLCVATKPRRWATTNAFGDALLSAKGAAIALDRVRNPYNIGAILRTAAFFGLDGAVLGAPAPHPALAPTAVRVAEGGAEHLTLARTTDLADTLGRLRARGVRVVGADGRSDTTAFGFAFARPTVLVMGNEREGIGDRIRAHCDAVVAIPGAGAIESLNVAVAASILVAEMVRARR